MGAAIRELKVATLSRGRQECDGEEPAVGSGVGVEAQCTTKRTQSHMAADNPLISAIELRQHKSVAKLM